MATSRFSFGVMAILAALVFALLMPVAVHAQSPAPAPTSDGILFLSLSLNTLFSIRSNIHACFCFLLHVDLTFGSIFYDLSA